MSSLSREEYLASCQVCYKRRFIPEKGLVCSLTNEFAAFNEKECPDFDLDQVALDNKVAGEKRRERNDKGSVPDAFSDFGIRNELTLGILISTVGLIWFIYGYSQGVIFSYSVGITLIGFTLILVWIFGKIRHKKNNS